MKGRLDDDFDLLIAEEPALQREPLPKGQSEVSPTELVGAAITTSTHRADDVLGDLSVAAMTAQPKSEPEPMVGDVSQPIVVDAPDVAAMTMEQNQLIDFVDVVTPSDDQTMEAAVLGAVAPIDDEAMEEGDSVTNAFEIGGVTRSVDTSDATDFFGP